jgi:hypothetical protein
MAPAPPQRTTASRASSQAPAPHPIQPCRLRAVRSEARSSGAARWDAANDVRPAGAAELSLEPPRPCSHSDDSLRPCPLKLTGLNGMAHSPRAHGVEPARPRYLLIRSRRNCKNRLNRPPLRCTGTHGRNPGMPRASNDCPGSSRCRRPHLHSRIHRCRCRHSHPPSRRRRYGCRRSRPRAGAVSRTGGAHEASFDAREAAATRG